MAYYKGQLVLHGHTFAIHARSRAKREDWRREEDGLNARESCSWGTPAIASSWSPAWTLGRSA